MYCRTCGRQLDAGAAHCPGCGAWQPPYGPPSNVPAAVAPPAYSATSPVSAARPASSAIPPPAPPYQQAPPYSVPPAATVTATAVHPHTSMQSPTIENLSVGAYTCLLLVGLLPCIGLFLCLLWAFTGETPQPKRNLAKAMLWLHGLALLALVLVLGVWVLGFVVTV